MDIQTQDITAKNSKSTVVIERKSAFDWASLKAKVEKDHWRKLKVTIRVREKLHGGKPKELDAANAMLNARGLNEVVEARLAEIPVEERAEKVVDEGLCEFHRREGKPGLWMPSNNLKAMLKENWSALGYYKDATPRSKRKSVEPEDGEKKGKALQGSRGRLHEGVFVRSCVEEDEEWIYLGDKPDGIDVSVSHTKGPNGPVHSIKRNEFVLSPTIEFMILTATQVAGGLPDETLADVLIHAQEHGVGANRSQGRGTFNVLNVEEV